MAEYKEQQKHAAGGIESNGVEEWNGDENGGEIDRGNGAGKKEHQAAQVDRSQPDLAPAIKRQVEYYFSNRNYYKDKWLLERAAEVKNQGYIPISDLLTFNKMRLLTQDVEKIKQCLKDSQVVEIEGDRIRKRNFNPGKVKIILKKPALANNTSLQQQSPSSNHSSSPN